ncbi:MAG TPA: S41 family peptidase [Lachnospiraceae bacterium]|nr:S41 family peptidase [Lachnospiraceae bacterium]
MEDNSKNHSFGKGLVAGMVAAAIIFGLTGRVGAFISSRFPGGHGSQEERIDAKLEELDQYIDQYYLFDYEETNLESGIYKGLMAGLGDIYTGYYTPEEYASFMETTNGSYSGIGAMLRQDYKNGIITVYRVFDGSPAAEAGIEEGDILYTVKGEEVTGKDLSLVVTDLKGEEGSTVDISILKDPSDPASEAALTLTRRHIEVPTVEFQMIDQEIGYIAITEFEDVTDDQFMAALDALEAQGMKDLVIDLRNNGGGLVDVTCAILDRLLPEGLIVYTEDKYGNRQEEKSDAEHYFAGDMAVLVNGNSASASEIFAGAIKDYGVGTLVGTQTFGKGIVQSLFPLSDGSAVKMTVSRYYTPKGNNIHEVGITPDVLIEYDEDAEEDNQLMKALEILSK